MVTPRKLSIGLYDELAIPVHPALHRSTQLPWRVKRWWFASKLLFFFYIYKTRVYRLTFMSDVANLPIVLLFLTEIY